MLSPNKKSNQAIKEKQDLRDSLGGQITCHNKVGDLSLIHMIYIREQTAVIASFLGGTEGTESRLLQDNPELPGSLTCSSKHSRTGPRDTQQRLLDTTFRSGKLSSDLHAHTCGTHADTCACTHTEQMYFKKLKKCA